MDLLLEQGLNDLRAKVLKARTLHADKGAANRIEALVEEISEAFADVKKGNIRPFRNEEWLDVACVALRAYVEGVGPDAPHSPFIDIICDMENRARDLQGG